ncbi:DoxX family protein [Verticiella sediminum]|uniref:DoxX family protein n=1 Tax=Verticiella sediminum TaxID=1247510 RepID=A0A556A9L2_9BURK|nr:DoxX family protein [Verticiella sediminum]TSH89561.1 DoxX family protein [Verticiella sediminum]
MLINKNDLILKASNFHLGNGLNVLRIAAGAFFFPHAIGKFVDGGLNPAVVGFFEAAGFWPASSWALLAAFSEITIGIALVLGICTRFAALGGALILAVAVYALQTVSGFNGWTWNTGGYEYPVFWGIVCIVISLEEFRRLRSDATPELSALSARSDSSPTPRRH